ncbi:tyrosine-type recombinase/integrase [Lederbergia citrisecunda]|uniref:tyrosine-type recombinase/integrase n=1 Tax=Lederbergia citrisecunda TaxID=2833583 RepID=UPI003D287F2B
MVSQMNSNVTKFQTKCGKVIEMYLADKKDKSANTESSYRSRIEHFLKHMFDKTIDTITSEELELLDYESFLQYVRSFRGKKNTTINNHISAIKSLYIRLKRDKAIEIEIDFLDHIEQQNDDGEEIEAMPIDVFYEFVEGARHETHNAKVKVELLRLAADQGLRLEANLSLTWRDFIKRDDGVEIRGFDKGNKKFTKVISHEMYEDLRKLRGDKPSNSKVFAPLSAKNVSDMMIRLRKKLGYEERDYSFHSLRKTAITFEHRFNGGNTLETQRFSGHSNLDTLQTYVDGLERGVRGMLSLGNADKDAYRKIQHGNLLEIIESLSSDVKHLINAKIQQESK